MESERERVIHPAMKPTYHELKTLNKALHYAIEWVDKQGQAKHRVPRGSKTSVRGWEAEIKRFRRLHEKVQAELREIRENKLVKVTEESRP